MSRRPRRLLLRAACVAAALVAAGPFPGAHADPGTPGAPSTPGAPALPEAPGSPAAPAAPGEPVASVTSVESVGGLVTRLQGLYQQAEQATEAYNAAETALSARQGEERRLSTELGKARTAVSDAQATAGRLAREQYRGARGFSPYARMLFATDPQGALDQRRIAEREGSRRAAALDRLTRGEQQADTLATAARKALDSEQKLAADTKKHKDEAAARLAEVERMLASLTPAQLTEIGTREAADTAAAQRELVDSGKLGTQPRTPTAAGGTALTYATAQIGKPYVWGAEGPASFDCSGLTSQAWAHAGRTIPRTSQEQWAQLPKVPLDELRPGDLVVYFPTATHVALYVGDGKVIQAPRPGAKVKVSPIAANPLLGAVRPDPDGAPLTDFSPPPLPEAAAAGDDTGYSEAEAPATSAR
ncbi:MULTISPECIES: C40 family peptidase [unclassified Streptomyces]|uniref:C40 family peptidase n=1 Tax=unclassified Streptomyces TaxID=2593676 RepID=UPI000DC75AE2|nr:MULTISPECIES: C40 family peptidase [unclassified Streptomyces]AWZ09120.1 glycoside hydrolase [Streptomyces sp. ICC4]AWZ14760.1 glycoside hydrolase [Streptomyces sp. ICC1]